MKTAPFFIQQYNFTDFLSTQSLLVRELSPVCSGARPAMAHAAEHEGPAAHPARRRHSCVKREQRTR